MTCEPMLHWREDGQDCRALWRSESGLAPPQRVQLADDTLSADAAYRLACGGTALLWRGDFQNARQLLQAIARRVDRKPRKVAPSPVEAFNQQRMAQAQRARILSLLLIPFAAGHRIALRRAPDVQAACAQAYGASGLGAVPYVVSLRELLGLIGAYEWRKKGVEIAALGARIHPHYGVFSPVRGEYVALVAQQPLPAALSDRSAAFPAFDIGSDADIEAYKSALETLLQGDSADAILLIHAPSLTARDVTLASSLIDFIKQHPRARRFNILTNWAGEYSAQEGRRLFNEAGIPTYRTPESAVTAFMHMVEYRRNQKQLMETPASLQGDRLDVERCQQLLGQALERQQRVLDTHLAHPILQAAGLSTLATWIVSDAIEAALTAEQIGYPVAVKLRSPDIAHKSDVHGVMLNLRTSAEVAQAADAILDRVRQHDPGARIEGLLVQRMARRSGGLELRIRLQQDPVFGPVILLGESGAEPREMVAALPPLNQALARYQIIGALKDGKIREQASPVRLDIDALGQVLCQLSELLLAFPEIQELDLHPLQACGEEMVILDARLVLAERGQQVLPLAIRPYPTELEEGAWLKDQSHVLLRPIRPEDEPAHKQFVRQVSDEDRYKRFFADVGELGHEELARMTQIDYDREMAFVAVGQDGPFSQQILGVVRAIASPDQSDAEFAILVRSDLKGLGLGKLMMEKIVRYARERGIGQLSGMTMPSNRGMINLAKRLGFKIDIQLEDGIVNMELPCADQVL